MPRLRLADFAETEGAPEFGGYLERALEAAENVLDAFDQRLR